MGGPATTHAPFAHASPCSLSLALSHSAAAAVSAGAKHHRQLLPVVISDQLGRSILPSPMHPNWGRANH